MTFMTPLGDQARLHLLFAMQDYDREEKRGRALLRCGHMVLPGILLEPDGSYTLHDRNPTISDLYVPVAPDIAIEVIAPNSPTLYMDDKAQLYLQGGTRMFWVIFPDNRCLVEYRAGQPRRTLIHDDLLDGDDVLPGFTLPVREIFPS